MSSQAESPQILAQNFADACARRDEAAKAGAEHAIVSAAQPSEELDQALLLVAACPALPVAVQTLAAKITLVAPQIVVSGTGNATAAHGGTAVTFQSAANVTIGGKDTRSEQERTMENYRAYLRTLGDMHLIAKMRTKADSLQHPKLARVYVGLEVQAFRRERETWNTTTLVTDVPDGDKRLPVLSEIVRQRQLVILGEPGAGKSTVGRHLCCALGTQDEACLQDWPVASRPTLPVFIELRELATSLPKSEEKWKEDEADRQRVLLLWSFLDKKWKKKEFTGLRQIVEAALAEKKKPTPLFYFDGLDEVRPDLRRRVAQVVRAWGDRYTNARILVSCRVRSYLPDSPWRLPFPDVTLLPFTLEAQVPQFVQGWFAELESIDWLKRPAAELSQELLKAIDSRPELQLLAPSPLLLTMMCLVHGTDEVLPSSKAKLYHRLVMLLLWEWEEEKDNETGLSALFRQIGPQMGSEDLLQRLSALVYQQMSAWATSGKRRTSADELVIQESDLRAAIMKIHTGSSEESRDWAERVLRIIRQRVALLLPQDDYFTFPHKSLAEFLCALQLCDYDEEQQDEAFTAFSSSLEVWDDWREIGLLAAGYVKAKTKVLNWLHHLMPPLQPWKTAAQASPLPIIAAEMLIEIGWPKLHASSLGKEQWQRTRAALGQIVQKGWLPPLQRARAGRALGCMGDDRPGVCDFKGIEKPDSPFWAARILPGPFSVPRESDDGFTLVHKSYRCTKTFAISRHPITVAQYTQFIDAGGYREPRWWSPVGWNWVQKEQITGPRRFGSPYDLPNHPQTGVSWFEVSAFAAWLAESSKLPISIPSEVQWRRAAHHTDSRLFPWGERNPQLHSNNLDTFLFVPSPVGMFPSGKAACGALDLGGNVLEWVSGKNNSLGVKVCGGAYCLEAEKTRGSYSAGAYNKIRDNFFGFRVVVSPF